MGAYEYTDETNQDRQWIGAPRQEARVQLAEVMVTRDMFDEMLERIGRLRFNPG